MVRGRGAGGWVRPTTGPCPARWEGDLPIGRDRKSAAGTLVKRTTRCVLLLHPPAGRNASLAGVRDTAGDHHPARIWDQGNETATVLVAHPRIRQDESMAADPGGM
jgi:IS30 family transposase